MSPDLGSSTIGSVVAVCLKAEPGLPKLAAESIDLVEGLGVRGDYHSGPLVRHRYLARKDPSRPNNRQVLLTDTTMLSALTLAGIGLNPGMLGENIVLDGVSVMAWAIGTIVQVGDARLEITEVRTPCQQLNGMHPGLLEAVSAGTGPDGRPNAGMLARVLVGGRVAPGDPVRPIATIDRDSEHDRPIG